MKLFFLSQVKKVWNYVLVGITMADHYQDHDLVNFQIQNMSDSEVPNTLRIRFSLVTINIIFGFVGKSKGGEY